ncbi:MAG: hypothetical protein ACQEQF_00640 [Bacillota bacterium]
MVEMIFIGIVVALYIFEKYTHVQEIKERDKKEEMLLNRLLGQNESDYKKTPKKKVKNVKNNIKKNINKDSLSHLKK